MKTDIYDAGRLEGTFFVRAVMSGRPGTTGNLIDLSVHDVVKKIIIENATGRAREYLSSDEIEIWRSGLNSIVGRKPTDEEIGQYALGKINAYATTKSAAAALGRKGGSAKSEAKSASSRENGKRGGRPKKATDTAHSVAVRRNRNNLKLP